MGVIYHVMLGNPTLGGRRGVVALAAAAAAFAGALLSAVPAAAQITGPARVIDGDTVEVRGLHIRLHGVDAPEADQRCDSDRGVPYDCGVAATRELARLVEGRPLTCHGRSRDSLGRLIAVCTLGSTDVGEQLVRAGWALADPQVGDYLAPQRQAEGRRAGLWAGRFVPPWDWRQGRRGVGAQLACVFGTVEAGTPGCTPFRAGDGSLFALRGDIGLLEPGIVACLCGTLAAGSFCVEGTPLLVSHVGTDDECAASPDAR